MAQQNTRSRPANATYGTHRQPNLGCYQGTLRQAAFRVLTDAEVLEKVVKRLEGFDRENVGTEGPARLDAFRQFIAEHERRFPREHSLLIAHLQSLGRWDEAQITTGSVVAQVTRDISLVSNQQRNTRRMVRSVQADVDDLKTSQAKLAQAQSKLEQKQNNLQNQVNCVYAVQCQQSDQMMRMQAQLDALTQARNNGQ